MGCKRSMNAHMHGLPANRMGKEQVYRRGVKEEEGQEIAILAMES
jgi:hypothetical protein